MAPPKGLRDGPEVPAGWILVRVVLRDETRGGLLRLLRLSGVPRELLSGSRHWIARIELECRL